MILGMHSLQDVIDVLKAKDQEVAEMQKGFDAVPIGTFGRDDWGKDWTEFRIRYIKARNFANARITQALPLTVLPGVDYSKIPDSLPSVWDGILDAFTVDRSKGIQKGDFQDLYGRLIAMNGKIDEKKVPQPSQDADMKLDIALGQTLNTLGLPQKLPDVPKPNSPVGIFTMLAIGGAIAAGGAIYLGWKPFAPKPYQGNQGNGTITPSHETKEQE